MDRGTPVLNVEFATPIRNESNWNLDANQHTANWIVLSVVDRDHCSNCWVCWACKTEQIKLKFLCWEATRIMPHIHMHRLSGGSAKQNVSFKPNWEKDTNRKLKMDLLLALRLTTLNLYIELSSMARKSEAFRTLGPFTQHTLTAKLKIVLALHAHTCLAAINIM